MTMIGWADANGVLREVRARLGGSAAALVSANGGVLAADLPAGVSAETFGVMCATILGAATVAHRELAHDEPGQVHLLSVDAQTLILEAGRGTLLVIVLDRAADPKRVLEELARFVTPSAP
jgi:predicted regulator of Ras-like GTPase activity (Roadblock/LC7/MglB family)